MSVPQNILVASDFSEQSEFATDYAIDLAAKLGATVHIMHSYLMPVLPIPGGPIAFDQQFVFDMTKQAEKLISDAVAKRQDRGVVVQGHVRMGELADAMLEVANDMHADLIVVGTHERGAIERLLLGSASTSVVRHAKCPVLVARRLEPTTT